MRRCAIVVLVLLVLLSGCADVSVTTKRTTEVPVSESPETVHDEQEWTVDVVSVVDGDTLEVKFPDGHTENVRLLGVDTPEVHVEVDPNEYEGIPDTAAGREWLGDWGHKASEFARTQVGGKTVTIATDSQADRRGGYGRLLVYVYMDGENFNRQLIQQGYARLYDSEFAKRDSFASAEQSAQENNVGLWNFDSTTTAFVGADASVSIHSMHWAVAANDHETRKEKDVIVETDRLPAIK